MKIVRKARREKEIKVIRTGIVGFGKMGLLHGALVNYKIGMELVAICERSSFLRRGLKSVKPQINFYRNHKEMIDREMLDAIIITTPTYNHIEIAMYAAHNGIAVFCEKPLSCDGASAEKLSKLIDEKCLPSMVGFSNRFFPTINEGKRLISKNVVGVIKEIKGEMYIGDVLSKHDGWRYDPNLSGGGVLIDFGIHMIDLLVWYFGEVHAVIAWTKNIYSTRVEDEAGATLFFKNGLNASLETSWSKMEYRKSSPKITVKGDKGVIMITEQTIDINKDGKHHRILYPDVYKGSYIDIAGINYTLEINAFYDQINGIDCGLSIRYGAYIQKLIDKMYESANDGKMVEV